MLNVGISGEGNIGNGGNPANDIAAIFSAIVPTPLATADLNAVSIAAGDGNVGNATILAILKKLVT